VATDYDVQSLLSQASRHHRIADRLLLDPGSAVLSRENQDGYYSDTGQVIAAAQVHAVLALAAATLARELADRAAPPPAPPAPPPAPPAPQEAEPLKPSTLAQAVSQAVAKERGDLVINYNAYEFPYQQFAGFLRKQIEQGVYTPGSRLPPAIEMAKWPVRSIGLRPNDAKLGGLSSGTIRKGLRLLVAQGWVVYGPGNIAWVAETWPVTKQSPSSR
jgi:hypothetical protein